MQRSCRLAAGGPKIEDEQRDCCWNEGVYEKTEIAELDLALLAQLSPVYVGFIGADRFTQMGEQDGDSRTSVKPA